MTLTVLNVSIIQLRKLNFSSHLQVKKFVSSLYMRASPNHYKHHTCNIGVIKFHVPNFWREIIRNSHMKVRDKSASLSQVTHRSSNTIGCTSAKVFSLSLCFKGDACARASYWDNSSINNLPVFPVRLTWRKGGVWHINCKNNGPTDD